MHYYVELQAHSLFGVWRGSVGISLQDEYGEWQGGVAKLFDGLPLVPGQDPQEAVRDLLERVQHRL